MLATTIILFAACTKKNDTATPSMEANHKQDILLKSVTIEKMPAPYYSFSYAVDSCIQTIQVSNGFNNYSVAYKDKKVLKMTNDIAVNKDTLQYLYVGNKIAGINVTDQLGQLYLTGQLAYDERGRLKQLQWFNTLQDRYIRGLYFKYDGNDNMIEMRELKQNPATLELEPTFTYGYSDFDDKENVDAFHILNEQFAHFTFLPGVKLQKNNPRTITMKGAINDYLLTCEYIYSNRLPLEKKTTMKQTRGGQSGMQITTKTSYEYF